MYIQVSELVAIKHNYEDLIDELKDGRWYQRSIKEAEQRAIKALSS